MQVDQDYSTRVDARSLDRKEGRGRGERGRVGKALRASWGLWEGPWPWLWVAVQFSHLQIADLELQIADSGFQMLDFGFQISDFRLQIADISDSRSQISDFRLRICRLQICGFRC